MSLLPKINMRRTYLIARRDYLGYIKTWGFWISFFLPFIFGILGGVASTMEFDFSPTKYETIIDETGTHRAGIEARLERNVANMERDLIKAFAKPPLLSEAQAQSLMQVYDERGAQGVKEFAEAQIPGGAAQVQKVLDNLDPGMVFIDPPAQSLEALKPYLTGEKTLTHNGEEVELNGAVMITGDADAPLVNYWSTNFNNPKPKRLIENYFKDRDEAAYLSQAGLSKSDLKTVRSNSLEVEVFNPAKAADEDGADEAVNNSDKVPYFVAAAMAGLLWLTVFSGAYMLLTSMLEEKLNKLMEMMLASTRFSEIIFGKLLGVAALTITAMLPYIIIGIGLVLAFIFLDVDAEIAAGLSQSFTPKLIIFFFVFLILGYIFYGACFIALGSLSQSMQDAQTLTTPIVLILTLCVFVVPLGLENPDSPILRIASIFPLSAPFASIARLPSDPPLWELLLSAFVLALLCIGVVALAGRIFRYGVMSGSGAGAVVAWFKRTILRRPA